jgi:predicted MFS family arabinose efflux permease
MPALAPIIGGYIETSLGWRANFIFLALLVMSTWLIIWQWLPETNKNLDPTATQIKIVLKNYLMLLTHRSFISHVALASLGMAGLVTYITISPFLFQNILGLSPIEYGWLAIYITIGIMIGQYLNSLLVTKFGIKNMLLIGILAMLFSGIALLITGVINFLNTTAIMIPVLIFTAGLCFVFSNAMTSAFHPFPHMAGSAGAMYGCLQTFGGFLTSLIVAGIHETNQLPLATIYIFLGTASALIYYFFIRKEQL